MPTEVSTITDIAIGKKHGVTAVLVLSGVTSLETLQNFPYRPKYILNGVGDLPKNEAIVGE